MKKALLNIENLSLPEVDTIFSIISGGDFMQLQAGSHAITKDNHLITVIGFSDKWQDPNKLASVENDILNHLSLKINLTSMDDKIVGLYYDQQAKERQELISVNIFDATPIIDLDKEKAARAAKFSLLQDAQVLHHFMNILNQAQVTQQSSDNRVLMKEIYIHVLKSFSHMMNVGGNEFIQLMKNEGLLDKFVIHLYERLSQQNKQKDLVPIEWVEMKCSEIKKTAMENDVTLVISKDAMNATVHQNKQVIFKMNDPETHETVITNAYLISAINLHNSQPNKQYGCHLQKDITNFINEPLKAEPLLMKKFGLVFYEGKELEKLDDKALNILLHSQIVLTTCDIQPKELFTKLVELTKKDDEKPEKERQLVGLLESVILFVKQYDFERVQNPIKLQQKPLYKQAPNALEGLIRELQAWANIDRDLLMYYLADQDQNNYNVLSMKIVKILKDLQTERQKNKDKLKKLEVDKKFKEIDSFKKKLAETEAKRAKDIEDKLAKIKSEGYKGDELSLIERIVLEASEKETTEQLEKDVAIIDLMSEEKKKEKIEGIISKKISPFSEDKIDDAAKTKSEQAMAKEFFEKLRKYDDKNLPFEYESIISNLSYLYSRRTLVNILSHCDLKFLIPTLIGNKKDQKKFSCFIKSTFHECILLKLSSGNKEQLKGFKKIIRDVFEFCIENPVHEQYIKDFLRFDLIESGNKTILSMFEGQVQNVRSYFKSEEKAMLELNPYLLLFILNIYQRKGSEYLLQNKSYIPAIFQIILYMIVLLQDDNSGIKVKLYGSLLKLLEFVAQNLEICAKNGIAEKLLNNELIKEMVQSVDYDSSDTKYNNQQKLLLEIHMKLLDLHNNILEKAIAIIDSNLENSEGILKVKRGKTVLNQKDKFDFLKYYIHYQNLDEQQKELLKQTIETNHYAFNSKVVAKFSFKQSEKLKLEFSERTVLKDFTFLGIGQNANGKNMDYYSTEQLTKDCKTQDIYKGEFYLLYPMLKQIVVAFGEGANERLGLSSSSNSGPKAAYSTKELKPKKIITSYSHTVIVDSDNELFRCGYIKRSGNTNSTYQKVSNIQGKIKLVSCGKNNIFVVTEDNKIFRQGFSKDGHLGLNSDYSNMTALEKNEEEEQITETIVDITSGTHFTLFVTENGKLYGIGNRFLKEIGLDCDSKVIQIPLKEGVKVLRAWGSMGKQQPLAFIKVQLEDGREELWSAGRNEQGLLGQGQLVKVSKSFKPVKYNSQEIQFVDFSTSFEHAMAIDQEGNLYAWGSNISKRAGFKEEIFDGIFEPRKVVFHLQENLKPIKVKCGFDHTLILFEDENQVQKLYSIGQDPKNYYHLGISATEAEEKNVFFREVSAFRGYNILDLAAGYRTSHVILQGDKEPTDNLYEHAIEGQTYKGLLHFYKDENNEFHFISQSDYEQRKEELPDICFAIKCPILNIKDQEFPDLIKLAKDLVDYENPDDFSKEDEDDITCSVTQQKINGPRYVSISKINGDDQKIQINEKSIFLPTIYDINPLVYYRIKKPLKKGAKLPNIDLKKYFQETAAYGLDITVSPNLEFQPNDSLITQTKTTYDELLETINKFLPELDQELLKEMDRYVKANLSDKNIADIKAKDDFKINDMTFKNPKLKKLTENVKRKRIELYLNFNQMFINLMPYISLDENASGGDMSKNFQAVKNMILFSMKNKFLQNTVNSLPTGSSGYVEIRRRKAQRFCEQGKVDHRGEHTIFGQIFQQIKKNGYECFRQNTTDQRTWSTKFLGEGSIDAGGPYREALTNMCSEIESDNLPLLIKTPNNRNNHGENRDCFIPNPSSNTPTHLEMLKFMGCLLGYGIRTLCPIPLHFPPIFWKLLLNEPLEQKDLKGFDTYSWQVIEDLKKQSQKLSDEEFNLAVEEKFVTRLSDGTEVELCRDGKQKLVTKENLNEFIELMLEKRFNEFNNQLKPIKEGISYVIPIEMLKLFTSDEIESRACGDKILDIDKLKKITEYSCCSEDNEFIQRFWRVLESLSEDEKTLYLKFVWGRSRLPYETETLRDKHCLYYCSYRGDKDFPEAHTCFFQLDLPKYTTDEICKQRLVTAITMCGEIDADHSADYIPDDNDEE